MLSLIMDAINILQNFVFPWDSDTFTKKKIYEV